MEFEKYNEKIWKTKGKIKKRAIRELDNYINQEINKMPWDKIGMLAYENLTGMKNKTKNHKQKHWSYIKIIKRILEKCEEYGIRPVYVNPKNTSRTCLICDYIDAKNRDKEKFKCLKCGFECDADTVGAKNVLRKAIAWLEEQNKKYLEKIIKRRKLI